MALDLQSILLWRHATKGGPFARLLLGLVGAILVGTPVLALELGSVSPYETGGCANCNTVQRKSAQGQPSYKVPRGKWKITSWSAQGGGTAAGKAQLRIYRPTGVHGQFRLVTQSRLEKVPATGHPEFETNLTVKGGDLLGIYTVENVGAGYSTGNDKDLVGVFACYIVPGDLVGTETDCALNPLRQDLANIKATLSKID